MPDETAVPIRRAIGSMIRRMRTEERLSLDEVERLTREAGARVTRSHLSRVETGQADLALHRFLALMRALGRPRGGAAEEIDALFAPPPEAPPDGGAALGFGARNADPAAIASALRGRVARGLPPASAPAVLRLLARSEAALGRWGAAERALSRSIDLARGPAPAAALAQLAIACAASGRPALARALCPALRDAAPALAPLIAAASGLDEGLCDRTIARLLGDTFPDPVRPIAQALAAEGYLGRGQPRAAWRLAQALPGDPAPPAVRAEALLTRARCARTIRRPRAGLAALAKARRLAREARIPELLARIEREAARCLRAAAQPERARAAARSAAVLLRRIGADRPQPGPAPWQSLLLSAEAIEDLRGSPRLEKPAQTDPSRAGNDRRSSIRRSPSVR